MIRSAALMATSVPEPTARPRSARASAGPSFTPSPDHGHRSPLALQPADHRHLVAGERPGHHRRPPRSTGATARAVGSLSPVNSTQCSPRPSEVPDRRRRRTAGPCRPARSRPPRPPSPPTTTAVRPEPLPSGAPLGQTAPARSRRRSANSSGSPDRDVPPSTMPRGPEAGEGHESVDRGRAARAPVGPSARWPGPPGARTPAPAPRPSRSSDATVDPGHRDDIGDRHVAPSVTVPSCRARTVSTWHEASRAW